MQSGSSGGSSRVVSHLSVKKSGGLKKATSFTCYRHLDNMSVAPLQPQSPNSPGVNKAFKPMRGGKNLKNLVRGVLNSHQSVVSFGPDTQGGEKLVKMSNVSNETVLSSSQSPGVSGGGANAKIKSIGKNRPEFSSELMEKYTLEELREYRDVFSLFDRREGLGNIGTNELGNAMSSLGMNIMNEGDLKELIREVDIDGDGHVNFEEFCSVLQRSSSKKATDIDDIVRSCFAVFDQDGDGSISEREFRTIFSEVGGFRDVEIDDLFKEFDILGNGKIDYDEFSQMVRSYWLDEDDEHHT